jgi:hypothetical protein
MRNVEILPTNNMKLYKKAINNSPNLQILLTAELNRIYKTNLPKDRSHLHSKDRRRLRYRLKIVQLMETSTSVWFLNLTTAICLKPKVLKAIFPKIAELTKNSTTKIS